MFPRSFRFSLRTMFVGCLLMALAAAWFGLELRAQQRQRAAINSIRQRGGVVWYDRADRSTEVEFVVHPGKGCGQTISLGDTQINQNRTFNEQDFALFDRLRRLRMVDFTGSQVSAAAIEDFRRSHPSLSVKP